MKKRNITVPFFTVNPKAYLYGEQSVALAKHADTLAEKYGFTIFFTAQPIDMPAIRQATRHLILTAQHMDALRPGAGMGYVLPEALQSAGVEAVFLNHAEHPVSLSALAKTMARADELGMLTIVCADTVEEARAIAVLKPDIMVCEPTSLIGTGKISDPDYMAATNQAVKAVSPNTLVLQAAGISTGENVYDAICSGADGTGGTSGIVAAPNPFAALDDMILALDRAREKMAKGE